jgi:hypothetical protein
MKDTDMLKLANRYYCKDSRPTMHHGLHCWYGSVVMVNSYSSIGLPNGNMEMFDPVNKDEHFNTVLFNVAKTDSYTLPTASDCKEIEEWRMKVLKHILRVVK